MGYFGEDNQSDQSSDYSGEQSYQSFKRDRASRGRGRGRTAWTQPTPGTGENETRPDVIELHDKNEDWKHAPARKVKQNNNKRKRNQRRKQNRQESSQNNSNHSKFLVSVGNRCDIETLKNYLEAMTTEGVARIAPIHEGEFLVFFDCMRDFSKAEEKISKTPLEGAKVTITRLCHNPTWCVRVEGFASGTTFDQLRFYFANAKNGGGEVNKLEFTEGNNTAVIYFNSQEVVKNLLSKEHKLGDSILKLTGVPQSMDEEGPKHHGQTTNPKHNGGNKETTSSSQTPTDYKPGIIEVAVDLNIMEFVRKSKYFLELVTSLREIGFDLVYKSNSRTQTITEKDPTCANRHDDAVEVFDSMMARFVSFDYDVPGTGADSWKLLLRSLTTLKQERGQNSFYFQQDANCRQIKVTCLKSLKEEIEKNLQAKSYKETTINSGDTDEEKIFLLDKLEFGKAIQVEYPDMIVQVDLQKQEVLVKGPKEQYEKAIMKVYQKLGQMSGKTLSLSANVAEMLNTDQGLARVKEEMKKQKIEAVFSIAEVSGKCSVFGSSSTEADKASEVVTKLIKEVKIDVGKDNQDLLASKQWSAVCDDVKGRCNVYVRRNKWNETWFTGFADDVDKAEQRVKRFLEENAIKTEKYPLASAVQRRYIVWHRMTDLKGFEEKLKDQGVKFAPTIKSNELSITGTKNGISRAKAALVQLVGTIVTKSSQVTQPGLKKLFADGKEAALTRTVEQEHHCVIEVAQPQLQGPSAGQSTGGNGSAQNAQRRAGKPLLSKLWQSFTGRGSESDSGEDSEDEEGFVIPHLGGNQVSVGKTVIAWNQGDIVKQKADILVTLTQGQLAKAFYSADPQLQQAVQNTPTSGGVTVTSSGSMTNCKHVMHGQCSNWNGVNGSAANGLDKLVQSCLENTDLLGMNTIAFPIIGTGGFSFPHHEACRIMLSSALNYCRANPNTGITDISLVVFPQDQALVTAFQTEFNSLTSKGAPMPVAQASSTMPAQISGVLIRVVPGDLTKENAPVDAIVNIIGTSMDMQQAGEVSKAVSAAAGPRLQQECSQLGQQPAGSAVITRGYNLGVNHVIHMVPGGNSKTQLSQCLESCLQAGDAQGFKSVSLPACGTGGFGLSEADSADLTFNAFRNICPKLNSITEIKVVIFNKATLLQAFQLQLHKLGTSSLFKKAVSPRKSYSSKNSQSAVIQPRSQDTVKFTVYGKSNNAVDDAVKALVDAFKSVCVTQEVKDEAVSSLSSSQRQTLSAKAFKNDIDINFDDASNRVVIGGGAQDVMSLVNDVWKELNDRKEKDKAKEHASVLYKTIRWQYNKNGTSVVFDKHVNAEIEKAHSNKTPSVTVKHGHETFVITMATMTGVSQSGGQQITVTRGIVGVTSGSSVSLPPNWDPMPVGTDGKEKTVHTVNLSQTSTEYQTVSNLFKSTGGTGNINQIQRVQNPHLYRAYMVKKDKMDKDNVGINNERTLFHGTNGSNVSAINTQGFNRSFAGKASGTALGNGVYFAASASYSMGYAHQSGNGRHMYVAKVLVGKYTQGRQGLLNPPCINASIPEILYDSVDNGGGSVFVVFHDSQCYPEYLITFQ
ncbi:uncharacterized protein LOC5500942 [Nematostella vectensis]|nr:uncharacterized protein LOC5500942 [Nematostella vectensis]